MVAEWVAMQHGAARVRETAWHQRHGVWRQVLACVGRRIRVPDGDEEVPFAVNQHTRLARPAPHLPEIPKRPTPNNNDNMLTLCAGSPPRRAAHAAPACSSDHAHRVV